ncbi:MAG: ABC transporter permease subunit [Acidobacteria bacterium]|nr:ABC transporter permease subunit [Acidobacteriota bacterium]
MFLSSPSLLVARREVRLVWRRRGTWGVMALLITVAWSPALLVPLRRGSLGVASFEEIGLLTLTLAAILLPLLGLLAGADLMAGEIEDATLVPLVTLPISRTSCFAGKVLGRGTLLLTAYLTSYGSVAAAVTLLQGTNGWSDYTAAVTGGLLLLFACGAVGTALGCSRRGRIGVFGSALLAWVVLVFALDALLLTALIALAPPPPTEIGVRGHSELTLHHQTKLSDSTERAERTEGTESQNRLLPWIAAVNPVQLFRLTALGFSPDLKADLWAAPLSGGSDYATWSSLAAGWLCWLFIPAFIGLRRFRRIRLF